MLLAFASCGFRTTLVALACMPTAAHCLALAAWCQLHLIPAFDAICCSRCQWSGPFPPKTTGQVKLTTHTWWTSHWFQSRGMRKANKHRVGHRQLQSTWTRRRSQSPPPAARRALVSPATGRAVQAVRVVQAVQAVPPVRAVRAVRGVWVELWTTAVWPTWLEETLDANSRSNNGKWSCMPIITGCLNRAPVQPSRATTLTRLRALRPGMRSLLLHWRISGMIRMPHDFATTW